MGGQPQISRIRLFHLDSCWGQALSRGAEGEATPGGEPSPSRRSAAAVELDRRLARPSPLLSQA